MSELLAFKDKVKVAGKWNVGLEPSKMNANSGSLGKVREQFALISSKNKLPRQVMANLFHLKRHLWLTIENQNSVYRCTWSPNQALKEECQDQSAMSAKDGGIYSESTGQLVIHFQNPQHHWKKTSQQLIYCWIITTTFLQQWNLWQTQWHKISVFKVEVTAVIQFLFPWTGWGQCCLFTSHFLPLWTHS